MQVPLVGCLCRLHKRPLPLAADFELHCWSSARVWDRESDLCCKLRWGWGAKAGQWKAEMDKFVFWGIFLQGFQCPAQYILSTAVTYWEVLQHHLFEPAKLREKGVSSEKGPASKVCGLICWNCSGKWRLGADFIGTSWGASSFIGSGPQTKAGGFWSTAAAQPPAGVSSSCPTQAQLVCVTGAW